jgi:SH3-like domain-containing protein
MSIRVFTTIALACLLALPSAEALALCVSSPYANLRGGPGTNFEKTWEVLKYTPLKLLKKKGKWYRVKDLEGDIHWVYSPLVTSKYKCAMIKDEKANIRKGPGTNFAKVEESPGKQYYSYKVVSIKGDWVKVTDEFGTNGWIFKKLLWIQ